jgi:hypothetical protein
MHVRRSRLLVMLMAVAATVGAAGTFGASAASAAPGRLAEPRSQAVAQPAALAEGTYVASIPIASLTSRLVITAGATSKRVGTFEFVDFGDYGDWVIAGRTIALQVASSVMGHEGFVMIGHVSKAGIVGKFSVPGWGPFDWNATRDGATAAGRAALAAEIAAAAAPSPAGSLLGLSGSYTAFFPGLTLTDTLNLVPDAFSTQSGSLTFVDLVDTGNWVQMGKHVALGVSVGPDAGVTMLGTRTATGISSAAHPGVYDQPSTGLFQWYAIRNAG